MNITELARQIRIPTKKLREILPALGFDIGIRAIKVDDKIARDIINKLNNPSIRERYLKNSQQPTTNNQQKEKIKTISHGAAAIKANLSAIALAKAEALAKVGKLQIGETIVVKELAQKMNMPVTKLILELMKNGVMASLNQSIDYETAAIIAEDLGFQAEKIAGEKTGPRAAGEKQKHKKIFEDDPKNLKPRPPIVTVMGHVDHGKTKLLDAIRQTNVVESEAGGITQHIGAYQVKKNNQLITLIDTPGHEAFSAMRSRGAQVADIAILVVAADDGVQPQTIEAISHIRAAGLPFIVAINKIDKDEANVDKIKSELAELKLTPEDWGGKTICVPISAKQKINIDRLLDTLLLVYEMESKNIQGNPNRAAVGTVIESHLDRGEGPVATVLIQTGTLKKGDLVKIGRVFGKIRLMKDWQGEQVDKAEPSMPVRIIGLKSVPEVGEILQVAVDTKALKKELKKSKDYKTINIKLDHKPVSTLAPEQGEDEEIEVKKINIILKSDVLGSQEAILESIENLQQPDLILNVVRSGLGNITEVDIERTEKQNALLVGFNVKPTTSAEQIAHDKNIQIKTSRIIYEILDYLKGEMNKILGSETKTEVMGKIKILKIFRTEKESQIIGGKVIEGKVEMGHGASQIKLKNFRDKELIGQAELLELQSAKQKVTEVLVDQEAGMKITGFNQVQEGDIIEVVKEEKIARSI